MPLFSVRILLRGRSQYKRSTWYTGVTADNLSGILSTRFSILHPSRLLIYSVKRFYPTVHKNKGGHKCAPGVTLVNDAPGGTTAYCAHGITKHYITDDDKPLWGLSTACAAMVCAVVPPVIASRPTYRQVRVLENQNLSRRILETHQAKSASEHGLHEARHHERLRRP